MFSFSEIVNMTTVTTLIDKTSFITCLVGAMNQNCILVHVWAFYDPNLPYLVLKLLDILVLDTLPVHLPD